jgi:fructose-1,6-bisphosphatase/inositol monophosphatase family enzyme
MIMKLMVERLSRILPKVRKVRSLGAAAAEMAYIGAGYLDGLFYEGLKPWDFAAGKIILEEAGGFVEAAETEPGAWRIFACAPGVKADLIRIIPL